MKAREARTRNRKAHGRITLADVALHAGVSTASVSRALNAPASVNDAIAQRVRQAASTLGYRANAAARTLAGHRSRLIGIIVPTIANSIFAPGVQAIEEALEAADYGLVITTSNYSADKELAQAQRLVSRGVEGLILVGTAHRRELHDLVAATGTPTVIQGAFDPSSAIACIGFDNRKAMKLMAKHVMDLGHRQIAILAGISRDNDRVQQRIQGVLDVALEYGIDARDVAIAESRYDVAQARSAAAALLQANPRPTAILCINDILAIGAVLAARDAGLRVPDDLAVTGFDDFDVAATFDPPITTIHVPVEEMGQRVATALLAQLDRNVALKPHEISVRLVVRSSCKRR